MNVLTDPVWGARVPPLPLIAPRRWVAPPVQITALPPIDAVLISHSHYDHLESASVRALSAAHPAAHWYVPLGIRDFVRKRGARHVHELDWYESTSNGEATFSATPAQHSSGRTPFDRAQTLWCGWAVTRGERRIYFAGDTAYFPGFPEIGQRYGPFDVALLPIGSTEPRSFMQYHHMNASDAVQAFQDLYSRIEVRRKPLMIPMHWGTYKLTIDPIDEPPQALRGAWSDAGLPNDQLRILRHGESEALTAGD
jgi:N-acyl-phosphatidylethanolamine-hydrolysing phospholipase D